MQPSNTSSMLWTGLEIHGTDDGRLIDGADDDVVTTLLSALQLQVSY
jgi:hypothetical protein